jgi:hypothetical protein
MSFVFAMPEFVSAAASDLANIGSIIGSANAAALGPTSGVLAAGADEVSATIAALFDAHAQAYQALSAQAALFHQQFVQLMSGGAAQYAMTEAANASPLQTVGQGVTSGVSAPVQAVAGAPPAGNSATGILTTGTGGGPVAFGPGGNGAAGRLIGSAGVGPAAAAVGGGGGGGGLFGTGGAGYIGSMVAGQNLGGVPAASGSGGLVGSAGAVGAAESAEELGIGGTPLAAAPASAVTPLAAVPATAAAAPAAAARPGTPAYSPATAAAAESPEE